jgi:2'-5' RNA ligase
MQRLLTISYPELAPEATRYIESFRQSHDAQRHALVPAHFTLVFGCSALGLDEYTNHVAAVASRSKPISFCCKYAMLGNDDENDTAYVFLVPDQGNSEISLLHDRLYSRVLRPHLRLDLPYVPHITIGSLASREQAKHLCDHLNQQGVFIEGRLTKLTVGAVEGERFRNLSVHTLGATVDLEPHAIGA